MAIIEIRTGGRGRPLKIDTDIELTSIRTRLPQLKEELASIRAKTSGFRDERVLGSATELPTYYKLAERTLERLAKGETINYNTARELKANIKAIKQLTAKTDKVKGRALAPMISQQYFQDIAVSKEMGSEMSRKYLTDLENAVREMNPREQQTFFTSKSYQSTATIYGKYERVVEWSKNELEKVEKLKGIDKEVTLTDEEAGYYLIYRRLKDGKDA